MLTERILAAVRAIPYGETRSYGQVAAEAGAARAARVVGWTLARSPEDAAPWWRVINKEGRLSIVHPLVPAAEQARRLREEGLAVEEREHGFFVVGARLPGKPASRPGGARS